MSGKRARSQDERQITWLWIDPAQLLRDEEHRGDVVFEAPEAGRIVSGKPPPLPRVRMRRARPADIESVGLPFGTRLDEGRLACWSCGHSFAEGESVSAGPGVQVCPGCGARLPFA